MNISEDMFTEFESCSETSRLTKHDDGFTELVKQIEGSSIKELNETNLAYDPNMSEAAIRSELLRLSLLNFKNNKEVETVYFQTEAIGIGVEYNYDFEKNKMFNLKEILETITRGISFDNLSSEELREKLFSSPIVEKPKEEETPVKKYEVNHNADLSKLKSQCDQLPKEWTTIQICKEYNPHGFCMTSKDIFEYNSSIYLSLLTYSRWELNNKNPICICLKPYSTEKYSGNIFNDVSMYLQELAKLTDYVNITKFTQEDKKRYATLISSIQNLLIAIIKHITEWIGPWICLFIGKPKTRSHLMKEKKLFKLVDDFCELKKYNKRQIVLTSLIARGLHLISDENISEATKYITSKKTEQMLCNNFLLSLKNKILIDDAAYYPCILIVDELLDQIPWEMVLNKQEFCRMYSFYLLIKLSTKYKKQIKNGYLHKTIKHGNCLINPDSNLADMEKRMSLFFNYWVPNWKCSIGKKLTQQESIEFLKSCDAYIYSGHGSGLQFLKANNIIEQKLDCIVFLFGCNSTTMKSYGHNTPMFGTHIYYHIAQCPTVVGMNFIATDFDADMVTALIISNWIPSKSTPHFKHINKESFRKGILEFDDKSTVKIEKEKGTHFNPNLAEIIANIRANENISLKIKSAIVFRGLPIWNSV